MGLTPQFDNTALQLCVHRLVGVIRTDLRWFYFDSQCHITVLKFRCRAGDISRKRIGNRLGTGESGYSKSAVKMPAEIIITPNAVASRRYFGPVV